jgi:hypothetical protein
MKTLTWSILGDNIEGPAQSQRGGKGFAFKTMGDAISVGTWKQDEGEQEGGQLRQPY